MVTGDSIDIHRPARDAVDRGDKADRQAFPLQHRALLDVHLDVTEGVLRRERFFGQPERIAAEREKCLATRHAVFADFIERLAIEPPGECFRAAQG